jgi:hypothetical protein
MLIKKWIHRFDKSLAHTICLYSILNCPFTINIYTIGYLCSCLYALFIFHIFKFSNIPGLKGTLWHASIHIITSAGMVLHYYASPNSVNWSKFLPILYAFYIIL